MSKYYSHEFMCYNEVTRDGICGYVDYKINESTKPKVDTMMCDMCNDDTMIYTGDSTKIRAKAKKKNAN